MENEFRQLKKRLIEEDFSYLNSAQAEACFCTEGPVLILAGAGSGKTTTLIARIEYMIKYGNSYETDYLPEGLTRDKLNAMSKKSISELTEEESFFLKYKPISPYHIMAITFTNKAAGELKARLENKLGDLGMGVFASTFHSACVRILRAEIEALGYNRYFTIFDTADSASCVKEAMNELGIQIDGFDHKSGFAYISSLKNNGVKPEDFITEATAANDVKLIKISKIYKLYTEKMKKYNALDFDDLLLKTVELFEKFPAILEKYQDKFRYIMVDEYQDTNKVQYRLISLLTKKYGNIGVVGDDDQSIYRFRGADIRNILDFEKDFKNARVIKLEDNYRSTKNILDAANGVIANNEKRKAKRLIANKELGEKVHFITPRNGFDEAVRIKTLIDELVGSGKYHYKDIAVLYRMGAISRMFEQYFLREGIPHRVVGGMRFFDRAEIKDIIAYLRLVMNENDDEAFLRIINTPPRGIGKTTVDRLKNIALETGVSLLTAAHKADEYPEISSARLKLLDFCKLISDISEFKDDLNELVNSAVYGTGYMDWLNKDSKEESKARAENLGELLSMTKEQDYADLPEFLESIALLSDIDNFDDSEDAVTLMTLHSAKGLEFPVVFIAGFEDGIFPSGKSKGEPGGIEEERRLCYVGITRAKNILYLSAVKERMMFGTPMFFRVSPFLKEIPEENLEKEVNKQFDIPKKELPKKGYVIPPSKTEVIHPDREKMNLGVFRENMRVTHKKFGKGTIVSALPLGNDVKLEIMFDDVGKKVLMAAYANLKII